jgi:hypothetical protein
LQVLVLLRLLASRCSCASRAFLLLPLMELHPYWCSMLLCEAIDRSFRASRGLEYLSPPARDTFFSLLHRAPHLPGLYFLLQKLEVLQEVTAQGIALLDLIQASSAMCMTIPPCRGMLHGHYVPSIMI